MIIPWVRIVWISDQKGYGLVATRPIPRGTITFVQDGLDIVISEENYHKVDPGLLEYIEKYSRTTGGGKRGLFCYNFCLDSNRQEYQPSGAMNVNKFKTIAFEFNTIETPFSPEGSNIEYICDLDGNAIGFRKSSAILNEYNFDLRIFEERFVTFCTN